MNLGLEEMRIIDMTSVNDALHHIIKATVSPDFFQVQWPGIFWSPAVNFIKRHNWQEVNIAHGEIHTQTSRKHFQHCFSMWSNGTIGCAAASEPPYRKSWRCLTSEMQWLPSGSTDPAMGWRSLSEARWASAAPHPQGSDCWVQCNSQCPAATF